MRTTNKQTRCPNGQCYDSRAVALEGDKKGMYFSSICEHVGTDGKLTCKLTGEELIRSKNRTAKGLAVDIWVDRPVTCPFEKSPATQLQWTGLKGGSNS